jgi:hypothetical protein
MELVADDLVCPACQGFVHPFLGCCPACGAERPSRYGEAIATGSLGARALLEDEATHRAVQQVSLRYSLKPHAGLEPTDVLPVGFGIVAGSAPYRATATADGPTPFLAGGPASADASAVTIADGSLAVLARPGGRALAKIPLEHVVAATPIVKGRPEPAAWAGLRLGGRALVPRRPILKGDLLVTFSAREAAGQVALANRRGLLAEKARPDHYVILARWLGILAAAAAESRWIAVGPAAYAADLGLGADVRATDTGASMVPTPASGPALETAQPPAAASGAASAAGGAAGGATGVRRSLEELEELRTAGLVTADEYAAKRQEILDRL